MPVTVLGNHGWGVDVLTIAQGAGAGAAPQVTGATGADDRVQVTFDADMSFTPTGRTMDRNCYTVTEAIGGRRINVFYVRQLSSTQVELVMAERFPAVAADYNLEVKHAQDPFGVSIDTNNNTASFSAQNTQLSDLDDIVGFFGLEAGMQSDQEADLSPDISAPTLQNLSPFAGETEVAVDTNILLDIIDTGTALDEASIKITVNGTVAWENDVQQAGFVVTKTPVTNGFRYEVNPDVDLPYQPVNTVEVYAEDDAPLPNVLDTSYTFDTDDTTFPTITNRIPAPTTIDVVESINISMSFNDVGSAVPQSSINVTVGGQQAILNGVPQSGFQGPFTTITANGSNGFDVVIDPESDLPSLANIIVYAECKDLADNLTTTTWDFTTVDYLGPVVTPVDPAAGETDVARDATITLQISDEDQVDDSTILVEVDRGGGFELAFEYNVAPTERFKTGYKGAGSQVTEALGIYTVVIDPETDFGFGETIQVRVTAQDQSGNPERLP